MPGSMTSLYDEHADIYDIAFDWDVSEDVAWMLERLGDDCLSVLEPGCGSGRIVEAFAGQGVEAVGIDRSAHMVEVARRRLRAVDSASVVRADMTDFSLDRVFDGAVCPINTLLHLSPADLVRHLEAMARHLRYDARYLVQLALYEPTVEAGQLRTSRWEISRGDTTLKVIWATEQVEPPRLRQRSMIEVVAGPRAGEVLEETHELTAWTPHEWSAVIERSRFRCTGTYDGDHERVPPGSTGPMLWHELTRARPPQRA
jgi:SAM-dependent methyltransferase